MNELQNFNFSGQEVRIITINNDPWFVAKDVADILGYSDTQAMTRRLDDEDVMTDKLSGMNMKSTLINESGLYSAILGSKKPEAKQFKRWVTSEVLPTIRKHGAYMTNEKAQDILHGNGLADLLIQAGEQIKTLELDKQQLQVELEEVREKTTYLDLILESPNDILITQIAQDYGLSAVTFNRILHNLRIQRRVNKQWVLYSKYMGKGYIGSRTRNFLDSTGTERTSITTTWKQKGRKFLYETLKKNGYLPIVEQDDLAS
ncbi:phage antirepressor [Pseudolactococcus piscium]|uniref:Bro family antirepressor n=1 Tax=Pseudolactococcus piscium MKFS47 TaxID=297352 RepID=A0A0D6DW27_9LACT|nr:phage antirepressor [Lactococcus piscium]CEN27962.1 Bro family antirepressor [Lactococcus piscium MKFS47]